MEDNTTADNISQKQRGRPFAPGVSGNLAGRPKGITSAYSLAALAEAIRNVEEENKINYLEEMVKQSLKEPSLARIVFDRICPAPREETPVQPIIIINHIPGLITTSNNEPNTGAVNQDRDVSAQPETGRGS